MSQQQNNNEWTPTDWYDPDMRDISVSPHTIHLDQNGNPVSAEGGTIPQKRGEWFVLNLQESNLNGFPVQVELAGSYYQGVEMDTIPPMHEAPVLLNKFPNELLVRPRVTDGGEGQITMYVTDPVLGGTKEKTIKLTAPAIVSSSSDAPTSWYDPSIQPTGSLNDDCTIDFYPSYIPVDINGTPTDPYDYQALSYQNGWCDIELLGNLNGNTIEMTLMPSYFNGLEIETIPSLGKSFKINKLPNTIKAKAKVLTPGGEGQINISSPANYSSRSLDKLKFVHDPSDSSSWENPFEGSPSTQWYDPSIQPTAPLPSYYDIVIYPSYIPVDLNGTPTDPYDYNALSYQNGWCKHDIYHYGDLYGNAIGLTLIASYFNGIEVETIPPLNEPFMINKFPNTILARPRVLAYGGEAHVVASYAMDPAYTYMMNGIKFVHSWEDPFEGSPSTQYYDPSIQPSDSLPGYWGISFTPYRVGVDDLGRPVSAEGGPIPAYEDGWCIMPFDSPDMYGNAAMLVGSYNYVSGMDVEMIPECGESFVLNKLPNTIKVKVNSVSDGGYMSASFVSLNPYSDFGNNAIVEFFHDPDHSWYPSDSGWDYSFNNLRCPECGFLPGIPQAMECENDPVNPNNYIFECWHCETPYSVPQNLADSWQNSAPELSYSTDTGDFPGELPPSDHLTSYVKIAIKVGHESGRTGTEFHKTFYENKLLPSDFPKNEYDYWKVLAGDIQQEIITRLGPSYCQYVRVRIYNRGGHSGTTTGSRCTAVSKKISSWFNTTSDNGAGGLAVSLHFNSSDGKLMTTDNGYEAIVKVGCKEPSKELAACLNQQMQAKGMKTYRADPIKESNSYTFLKTMHKYAPNNPAVIWEPGFGNCKEDVEWLKQTTVMTEVVSKAILQHLKNTGHLPSDFKINY